MRPLAAPAFQPTWARATDAQAPCVTRPASQPAMSTACKRGRGRQPSSQARFHPYLQPAHGATLLRPDDVAHAHAFARRLSVDRTPGRIDLPLEDLEEMALAVADARADGINPRTASKNDFAMREFVEFAKLRNFDPNLQTAWTRAFPERESLKLASYLLFRAQRAVPRSKKDMCAKPMSIYQNFLALVRVFKSRDVELPSAAKVRETLRGLLRRFVRRFGIDKLRPKRVEPITPTIVRSCVELAMAGTARVKGAIWSLNENLTCFMVTAWMVINLPVGSRKGESTKLPGDVDANDWFNRAAVACKHQGRTYVDPPPHIWAQLKEGDQVMLTPRGSKCDTWGTCHGTEPIILPFHDDVLNAARWMRDIELRFPVRGAARHTTPLFADENGRPFNDAVFATYIMDVLCLVLGEARARLYSPHSWRVWLATSLRMCGATDARIQAMGRWLNPESIKIYARITEQEYAEWVDRLMHVQHIDTARTTNLPVMDAADAIAMWGAQLNGDKPMDDVHHKPVARARVPPSPLKAGDRVAVYWTEMQEWYTGTFTSSRIEDSDVGGKQRASRIVYDATGKWATCSARQSTYWHCLDDEQWHFV